MRVSDESKARLITGATSDAGSDRLNCILVLPAFKAKGGESVRIPLLRAPDDRLAEAVGLAAAIGLVVCDHVHVVRQKPVPATLIGAGRVDEIAGLVRIHGAGLVIVDYGLTPIQQRNLETAWGAKVLDRTGLILEIFGERAKTHEGRLQVELAHLNYQKSRLVRSWTHLERQRGGFGFLGGPGETQIEADRRQIQTRIKRIEASLEKVRKMRSQHRARRRRVPQPVVALVGYTNAGKSTLFNRLTGESIMAKDMLFATLDPTLRRVALPHGETVVLSDTVGFISELPTALIAAFRATLEEVIEADLILHVRDIATPQSQDQATEVLHVLAELGVVTDPEGPILEVWNKIDLMDESARLTITRSVSERKGGAVPVSAATGEGCANLLEVIERRLMMSRPTAEVELAAEALGGAGWIYENAEVLGRVDDPNTGSARFSVRIPSKRVDSLRRWAEAVGATTRFTPPDV